MGESVPNDGSSKTTPTLDKLERIFRKLDLVMAWSYANENDVAFPVNKWGPLVILEMLLIVWL